MNKEYLCFQDDNYKKFKFVDNYFSDLAVKYFSAEEVYIPSIISENVLKKCNYIKSFPQQLTIASYFDIQNQAPSKEIKHSNFYFTPAACLHIYPMLQGKNLKNKVITTRAQVYRHENRFNGNSRLWNFTVREIVFIGNEKFVKESLKNFEICVLKFDENCNLNCDINNASDHFYPSKENRIKQKLQFTNSLKKELLCNVNGEKISLASFNYHGFHFSKPFEFDSHSTIVTGCVGIGLERWLFSLNNMHMEGDNDG